MNRQPELRSFGEHLQYLPVSCYRLDPVLHGAQQKDALYEALLADKIAEDNVNKMMDGLLSSD